MVCPRGVSRRSTIYMLFALIALMAPIVRSADDDQQPAKRQLTPEELLRKRIAESLAGIRDSSTPKTLTLRGPELSDREKVIHVLNRLSFGPTPGEVEDVLQHGGWEAWVKEQLDPTKIDDATCDRVVGERFPWTKLTIQQLRDDFDGRDNRGKIRQIREQLPECVLTRAILSKRQFQEVICDFWRNHFCVDQPGAEEKSRDWTDADYEKEVVRKYAFGTFRDMLVASATHPAMLEYLDNKLSKANNWNENYAREVMELHTLGADHGYGNVDVLELSKALTGWTYDKSYKFVFNANEHQPGIKHWLGMSLPQGLAGGVEALNTLADHPNTAQFISEKLCRYLVNDNPPPALVRHVVSVFRETHGNLPKVYWAIISSKEFMSRDNYRAKFKTPFQFAISSLRSTSAKFDRLDYVVDTLRRMGEPVYDCPDPTGYRDQAESWMDAGVLTTRWQFAWDYVRNSIRGLSVPDSFLARYRNLKPEEAEEKMIGDLIGGDCGDRELAALKDAASKSDLHRMASVLLGSPSFQQR